MLCFMMKNFIQITRITKPVGVYLLFLPCCWGLALAGAPFYLYFLFLIGAILMRSAGCIINDYFDRDFDGRVERTKNRPLATGAVTLKQALIYLAILLFPSLLILLSLPKRCWIIGLISCVLVCGYPLMKRITFFPQLFLGVTFNMGVLMGWFCVHDYFSMDVVLLYLAGILWTFGYDTIYGFQDIEDDIKIGVKSTSIFVKEIPKLFLSLTYSGMLLCIFIVFQKTSLNYVIFTLIFSILLRQVFTNINSPDDCLKKMKSNFWVGVGVTLLLV